MVPDVWHPGGALTAAGSHGLQQASPATCRQLVGCLAGVLWSGEGDAAAAITVTLRDVRCAMLNLDPDSATPAPEVLKAVVRANQNNAGIYGAVTRTGRLAVGQTIFLRAAAE